MFSWWLFIPLTMVYVYLAKLPYEIVLAGFLLDINYYFAPGIFWGHPLTFISILFICVAWYLDKKIIWRKVI